MDLKINIYLCTVIFLQYFYFYTEYERICVFIKIKQSAYHQI